MASRDPSREEAVRERYARIAPTLDECGRRLFVANEALSFGYGGITAVMCATGVSRNLIYRGIAELSDPDALARPPGRQRRAGGGRKKAENNDPQLLAALRRLLEPSTRGDPESPLLWTTKSASQLARALTTQGHPVSDDVVLRLLHEQGFTLQSPKKKLEGADHPDRDAQFQLLSEQIEGFMKVGSPVISVDTKKKELVGNYPNKGRDWHLKGEGDDVLTCDFPTGQPKAVPNGVYDIARNTGFVSVGISADTAEFAIATIGRWWKTIGKAAYPDARALLITADCGGSNSYRTRLWKLSLQKLADETGLGITVAHLPLGTSKWNKIEHRMFSHISMNWRGRPLVSYDTIVQLIGSTTSQLHSCNPCSSLPHEPGSTYMKMRGHFRACPACRTRTRCSGRPACPCPAGTARPRSGR